MQEYLEQSALSRLMDAAGLRILMLALCMGWFMLLWGVALPSFGAGAALYLMWLALYKKRRDGRLRQKEKRLRLRIGGELALERMGTEPESKTHFETALLLSVSFPLKLDRITADGVLCTLRGRKVLTAFCPLPKDDELDARTVLAFQRAVKRENAARGVLCLPCGASARALSQAGNDPPVRVLQREEMIALLGRQFPATDEQLIALGRRRKRRHPVRQWMDVILSLRRAGRYMAYGLMLLLLYFITGRLYYALPGILCLLLSAVCRCFRLRRTEL